MIIISYSLGIKRDQKARLLFFFDYILANVYDIWHNDVFPYTRHNAVDKFLSWQFLAFFEGQFLLKNVIRIFCSISTNTAET